MIDRCIVTLFVLLLTGCGPTHTAGTGGLATKDLAVLSIDQLPAQAPIQIHAIQFDGKGDTYSIGKSRDFYLSPGEHTGSFTLIVSVPGPGGWFVPTGALTIAGPKEIPLGTFTAGKAYEFAPTIEAFDKLADGGKFSLVREKAK